MKKGVLLINSGSPDSTNEKDVKKYLREFLMDPLVGDAPYFIRKAQVEFKILPQKLVQTVAAYQKIWWKEGAPLLVITERFREKLAQKLEVPVALGMRYQNPTIYAALLELHEKGVEEVLVVPLYPQYTMSTTESAAVYTLEIQKKYFKKMSLTFLNSFYNRKDYIEVLAHHIQSHLPERFDKILFSYGGIPEKHDQKAIEKGKRFPQLNIKTYRDQCFETTDLVRYELGLEESQVQVAFQPLLDEDSAIKPSTVSVLKDFPKENIKNIVVVSPAVVTENLETLGGLAIENKELFLEKGGQTYHYIPCLNDSDSWVAVIAKWIGGWSNKEIENEKI